MTTSLVFEGIELRWPITPGVTLSPTDDGPAEARAWIEGEGERK